MNTILAIFYSFNLAFCPVYDYGDVYTKNSNVITSEFGIDLFEHCKIYGGFSSVQKPITWNNYMPLKQEYNIGIEGHFDLNKNTHLKFGVKRMCSHPVKSWGEVACDYDEAQILIYLGVNGTVPIF